MKRTHQISSSLVSSPKKCLSISLLTLLFLLLLLSLTFLQSKPSSLTKSSSSSSPLAFPSGAPTAPVHLPKLAYLISGTHGQVPQMKRLLQAVYHPRNYYLLHLDLEASTHERLELAKFAAATSSSCSRVFRVFKNVLVVGNNSSDLITDKGPTSVAATLHALAILLKVKDDWDWFLNLAAHDYPLVSQDDLLHIFSYLPRDLNFLEHTSDLGWKEHQRARPIIIDPGLYLTKKSGVFWAKEKRSIPSSFKLFSGSDRMVLTRSFIDFCIWGWDNLPRTLLMYYTNYLSSDEGYFHTVVCNHKNYQNTTVNHDMRYVKWDNAQSQQPVNLTLEHFDDMIQSGAPFAHKISMGDPLLDKIDQGLLSRMDGHFTPGGWCLGDSVSGKDPCLLFGSPDVIKPSVNSRRLENLMVQLLDSENFRSRQCK